MKIIHLTDPHTVAEGQKLFGQEPVVRLRAAVADINAQHADAELCVITGDLAHAGEPAAYEAFREAIQHLRMPVHLLLGNHDDRDIFRQFFPEAHDDGAGFVQGVVATSGGLCILLDTNEAGTHCGVFCEKRRAWLRRQLEAADGKPVFLFMHHAPMLMRHPAMDQFDLIDSQELAQLLAEFPPVRHIFFGHVHRPLSGSWRGVPFSTLRGLNHQVWLDFSRTELICSLEPPAYAVAFVGHDSVVVHNHDFMDASDKYVYEPDAPPELQFTPLNASA